MFDYRISLNETSVLKGIAITAMLFHHLFLDRPDLGIVYDVALIGKVCVSLFLFLSGYGMAVQFSKVLQVGQSFLAKLVLTSRFLCKRYVKFYLNYWMIFVIAVPVGIFVFGRTLGVAYDNDNGLVCNLIKDIAGLRGVKSYNITWWFNRLILILYLFFPLLYWLMSRRFIALGSLILLLLWPREYFTLNLFYIFELLEGNLVIYTLVFAMGIYVAVNQNFINRLLNRGCPLLWVVVSLGAVVALSKVRLMNGDVYENAITIDAFITLFVVLSVVSVCRLTRRNIAPLAYVGRHSMNMYMIHTFILAYYIPEFIGFFEHPILKFLALFGTSLLISIVLEFLKTKAGFYRLQKKLVDVLACKQLFAK